MHLLVCGGAGFIGSNFVRFLAERDWAALRALGSKTVITLDKLSYAGNRANLSALDCDPRHMFVEADIGDTALVGELIKRERIDTVINFAAETHVDRSIDSPEPFYTTNVVGTLRLCEACRSYWKTLPAEDRKKCRFVQVSTDEVYGDLPLERAPANEDAPIAPSSPYAASKAAADSYLQATMRSYGMPIIITRCSNNYGPNQYPEKLIPLILLKALGGQPLPVFGDGQQVRDWIHVHDHCRALHAILGGGRVGQVYNIGASNELTNLTLIQRTCEELDQLRPRADGESYRSQISHVEDRPGHDRRYSIDSSKLRNELGWQPDCDFDVGLRKTLQWYLDNPQWCRSALTGRYSLERLGLGR